MDQNPLPRGSLQVRDRLCQQPRAVVELPEPAAAVEAQYPAHPSGAMIVVEVFRVRCAVCGGPEPQHVDHDHRNGWVRGILCFNCNGGLGQFRDSPELLAEAISYLKGPTWQRVLIHPGVFQMCSPMRGRPPSRSS